MAVHRIAPKCPICGEKYRAINSKRGKTFVGDSFIRWNKEGHICDRSGLLYFIERDDTRQWYAYMNTWTIDPLRAKFFRERKEAEDWLFQKSWVGEVMPITQEFPQSQVTEHEFVK